MPDYRRVNYPGGTYFFTVNLLRRRDNLAAEGIYPVDGEGSAAAEAWR